MPGFHWQIQIWKVTINPYHPEGDFCRQVSLLLTSMPERTRLDQSQATSNERLSPNGQAFRPSSEKKHALKNVSIIKKLQFKFHCFS
jgi:hypothetical protein